MDMLVKLYDLPNSGAAFERLRQAGVVMRRALAPEKHKVAAWVRKTFSEGWASEVEVAFSRQPVSCFIAVREGKIVGFACHDATCPNFFGPTPSSAVLGPQPITQKRLARWPSKAPSPAFIAACSSDAGPPSLLRGFGATPAARARHRGLLRKCPSDDG